MSPRERGLLYLRVEQVATKDFNLVADQTDDVGRIDFDGAAVDHHVDGMFEGLPDIVRLVHVFFGEFGGRTQNRLVEMLEKFLEERVRRHPHADFRTLDVQAAGDMRVGGENKRIGAGDARLHNIECKVVYTGVVGCLANIRNDERHEEFLHRLLERVKLVNGLGRFGVTADGVTGFGRVEYETVVFEGGRCKLHDSRLRINRMNFKTHGDNIDYPLTLRNDLGAFEGVLDMRKMERFLVDSC